MVAVVVGVVVVVVVVVQVAKVIWDISFHRANKTPSREYGTLWCFVMTKAVGAGGRVQLKRCRGHIDSTIKGDLSQIVRLIESRAARDG